MTKWAIFDLDNCVANDGWRIPHIHWHREDPNSRYHTYHSLAPFDEPHPPALATLEWCERAGARIAVLTARPVAFRDATLVWLERVAHLRPDALLMRNTHDHRHSLSLKREQLGHLSAHWGVTRVLAAFDDRPDVVAMYKENPLVESASVLAAHELCAYTRPKEQA